MIIPTAIASICIPTALTTESQYQLLYGTSDISTEARHFEYQYWYFTKANPGTAYTLVTRGQAVLTDRDVAIRDVDLIDAYINLAVLTSDSELLLKLYRDTYACN